MGEVNRATPAVSVIVPTFERRESLRRLLEALAAQTLPANQFEVLVSIDGSRDGTLEMLESFRAPYPLRWQWARNRGRAAACNAAIRRAAGEIVLMLDDDMEPTRGLLAAHRRAHSAGVTRCVLGPVPFRIRGTDQPFRRHVGAKFNEHLQRLGQPEHQFVLRDFYSGNTSVRRKLLLEVGLFDEDFRAYGNEDLELGYRLIASGVTLDFAPDAVAWQHYDKAVDALARDAMAKGRTAVLLCAKHPGALPGLRLGAAHTGSFPARAVRAALLRLTRVSSRTPRLVIGLTQRLDRLGLHRLDLYYRFVLDYLYWVGAHEALQEHPSVARALRGARA